MFGVVASTERLPDPVPGGGRRGDGDVAWSTVRISFLLTGCMYISTGEFWIDPNELLGNVSLVLSAGESPSLDVRSPNSAVDIPLGSGFLEADPLRPTSLLMPSTAPPFIGGFIIGGGGGAPFGGGGRDRTSESSEVWVDCVELSSSKLSFEFCGWGWRTMCPFASPSFAGNRPYWPAGLMCTMLEACENMADSSSGTKEGMSGARGVARVGLCRDGEEGGRRYWVAARMLDGKGGWDGTGEAAACRCSTRRRRDAIRLAATDRDGDAKGCRNAGA